MTMAEGRVLVTPRSLSIGHPLLDRLSSAGLEPVCPAPGRTPTAAELAAVLPECSGYLAGVEPVTGDLIAAAPLLRVIARNGVGVNNIDLDAAARHGVKVRAAAGANARGVAELAIGLMFSCARSLSWSDSRLKEHTWERRPGIELLDRTLGVVGLGAIGRTVAELGAALGMRVLGHDLVVPDGWSPPAGFRQVPLEVLRAGADVITLHVPPGDAPLVDSRFLAAVRPGLLLINTARAELVDAGAVLGALDSGVLAGYAVDAFVTEPPADWRIVDHDRVTATPHVGALTDESIERAASAAVEAILAELVPG
jgi:phosphoglycerate dehydrogenase-like enzyme